MIGTFIIGCFGVSAYLINKGKNGMKEHSEEEIKRQREEISKRQKALMKKRMAEEG